jgi:hypothetical protein
MAKITLKLPDDLAATLLALPEEERSQFAVALMRDGLAYREEDERPETQEELAVLAGPPTPEDIVSLGRGLADADAGRLVNAETVFANLRAKAGLRVR